MTNISSESYLPLVGLLGQYNRSMMVARKHVKALFLLVFSDLWLYTIVMHAKAIPDSLKPGDMLNHQAKLCSPSRIYCLDFVEMPSGSGLSYLQIANEKTVWWIWLANAAEPFVNNSGVLTLDHFGVLKITRQGRDPFMLFSPPSPNKVNTKATLLDSGNFVLQELHPNGSMKSVLWQSFDYPTDTLVAGMKLGINHKTGHRWFLVSAVSGTIFTSGPFTLEWDPKMRRLIIRQRGRIYWSSGVLNQNKRFEYIPENLQSAYEYTIVSNEDDDYFTYKTLSDGGEYPPQWALYVNGQLVDGRGNDIARADKCYGYNTEGGCERWKLPSCRHAGQVFDLVSGYLDNSGSSNASVKTYNTNTSLSISDCQASCWSNCDCVGFSSNFDNGTGCIFYEGSWVFVSFARGSNSLFMLNGMVPGHKGTKKWIWISAAIATSLTICVSIICLTLKKRKKDKKGKRMDTAVLLDLAASNESTSVNDFQDADIKMGQDLKIFSYASIMAATNGFSLENKLGEGGFGPVYKGKLPLMEKEIAIKRLSKSSGQGAIEFKNELTLICELQHMNLVQLLGFCIHEEERMLIYEYMPNKSLDVFLFDSSRSKLLDWKKRLNIIEGIAQGLLYLHKYSRLKVIHRDLKVSNILLDENMNPKISDFGMARMFTQQNSEANTNRIVGTFGYMSPEYAMQGIFSTKSDVYSFGVLMLEIISGRKNNTSFDDDHTVNLIGHAWELWKEGVGLQLMDPALNDSYVQDEVLRCICIGLLCVEENPDDRPTMSDVISMLTNESVPVGLPKRPSFYFRRKIIETTTSSSKQSDINSIYEVTLSIVDAR